jgi:hypothetical protein
MSGEPIACPRCRFAATLPETLLGIEPVRTDTYPSYSPRGVVEFWGAMQRPPSRRVTAAMTEPAAGHHSSSSSGSGSQGTSVPVRSAPSIS